LQPGKIFLGLSTPGQWRSRRFASSSFAYCSPSESLADCRPETGGRRGRAFLQFVDALPENIPISWCSLLREIYDYKLKKCIPAVNPNSAVVMDALPEIIPIFKFSPTVVDPKPAELKEAPPTDKKCPLFQVYIPSLQGCVRITFPAPNSAEPK
jgi:hypothetical protein